jgi:hypothetical protein
MTSQNQKETLILLHAQQEAQHNPKRCRLDCFKKKLKPQFAYCSSGFPNSPSSIPPPPPHQIATTIALNSRHEHSLWSLATGFLSLSLAIEALGNPINSNVK